MNEVVTINSQKIVPLRSIRNNSSHLHEDSPV